MATVAATRPPLPRRSAAAPVRPSGVVPALRGSLPALGRMPPRKVDDDAQWSAAIAAAKQRALEEEERLWSEAIARAKAAEEEREWAALRARAAAAEEREWAALRARAAARMAPWPRLVSWP